MFALYYELISVPPPAVGLMLPLAAAGLFAAGVLIPRLSVGLAVCALYVNVHMCSQCVCPLLHPLLPPLLLQACLLRVC
jgi:hypothetical protein